jgi:hypothetical protein
LINSEISAPPREPLLNFQKILAKFLRQPYNLTEIILKNIHKNPSENLFSCHIMSMKTEIISSDLHEINKSLQNLAKVLDKPENPFQKFLGIAATIASVLGVVQAVDIFMKWFN